MAKPRASITVGADTKQAEKKLKNLEKNVGNFSKNIQRSVGSSFSFIGKVAAAGFAILATGKIAQGIKDFASEGDRLAKTSKVIGLTAESLQELEYAAGQQGASAESLKSGFENMNKSIGQAKAGTGRLTSFLKKSNNQLLNQITNAKSSEEAFDLLTDAINKETDVSKRQALATAAFGGAASDMIKMADGGSEAINKLREAQRKHGVISNEAAAASEKFNDEMDNATRAMKGVMFTALAPLIPKFTALAQKVTDFFHANRELIGSAIEKFFNALGSAMDTVIMLWDSGLLPALAAGYTAILLWNGAMTIGAAVMGIYKTVTGALTISTALLTAKQWLLNIAMSANPIGLIILAFVALIAIVVLVIKNWDKIISKLTELWDSLKELFPSLQRLEDFFKNIYDAGTAVANMDFSKFLESISQIGIKIANTLPLVGQLLKIGSAITGAFSGDSAAEGQGANGLVTKNQGVIESNKITTNKSQLDVNFNNMPSNVSTSSRGTAPGININTGVTQGL